MRSTRMPRRAAFILFLVFATLMWPQAAFAAAKDKVQILESPTGSPVTGSFSALDRSGDAAATKVRTQARAGHAYTTWYVIFNAPQACSGGECGEDDIFDYDAANPFFPFNESQIEAARISVVWGGAGAVANQSGHVKLDGGLAEGEVPQGTNQVVIGRAEDGALVGLAPVTGLEDSRAAEIHIVIQDHGSAHDDPAQLQMQLTSFEGACNPDCEDLQFAVHQP